MIQYWEIVSKRNADGSLKYNLLIDGDRKDIDLILMRLGSLCGRPVRAEAPYSYSMSLIDINEEIVPEVEAKIHDALVSAKTTQTVPIKYSSSLQIPARKSEIETISEGHYAKQEPVSEINGGRAEDFEKIKRRSQDETALSKQALETEAKLQAAAAEKEQRAKEQTKQKEEGKIENLLLAAVSKLTDEISNIKASLKREKEAPKAVQTTQHKEAPMSFEGDTPAAQGLTLTPLGSDLDAGTENIELSPKISLSEGDTSALDAQAVNEILENEKAVEHAVTDEQIVEAYEIKAGLEEQAANDLAQVQQEETAAPQIQQQEALVSYEADSYNVQPITHDQPEVSLEQTSNAAEYDVQPVEEAGHEVVSDTESSAQAAQASGQVYNYDDYRVEPIAENAAADSPYSNQVKKEFTEELAVEEVALQADNRVEEAAGLSIESSAPSYGSDGYNVTPIEDAGLQTPDVVEQEYETAAQVVNLSSSEEGGIPEVSVEMDKPAEITGNEVLLENAQNADIEAVEELEAQGGEGVSLEQEDANQAPLHLESAQEYAVQMHDDAAAVEAAVADQSVEQEYQNTAEILSSTEMESANTQNPVLNYSADENAEVVINQLEENSGNEGYSNAVSIDQYDGQELQVSLPQEEALQPAPAQAAAQYEQVSLNEFYNTDQESANPAAAAPQDQISLQDADTVAGFQPLNETSYGLDDGPQQDIQAAEQIKPQGLVSGFDVDALTDSPVEEDITGGLEMPENLANADSEFGQREDYYSSAPETAEQTRETSLTGNTVYPEPVPASAVEMTGEYVYNQETSQTRDTSLTGNTANTELPAQEIQISNEYEYNQTGQPQEVSDLDGYSQAVENAEQQPYDQQQYTQNTISTLDERELALSQLTEVLDSVNASGFESLDDIRARKAMQSGQQPVEEHLQALQEALNAVDANEQNISEQTISAESAYGEYNPNAAVQEETAAPEAAVLSAQAAQPQTTDSARRKDLETENISQDHTPEGENTFFGRLKKSVLSKMKIDAKNKLSKLENKKNNDTVTTSSTRSTPSEAELTDSITITETLVYNPDADKERIQAEALETSIKTEAADTASENTHETAGEALTDDVSSMSSNFIIKAAVDELPTSGQEQKAKTEISEQAKEAYEKNLELAENLRLAKSETARLLEVRLEAERKVKEEQAARAEAEKKAAQEAAQAKIEAERKAAEELRLKLEAERKTADELKAKLEAEQKAKEALEKEIRAKAEAELRAKIEAEYKEKLDIERKVAQDLKLQYEAERKAAEDAASAKLEAERKAAETAAKARLEAERKAADELKVKLEAERKAAEELRLKMEAEKKAAEAAAKAELEAKLAAQKKEAEEAQKRAAEEAKAQTIKDAQTESARVRAQDEEETRLMAQVEEKARALEIKAEAAAKAKAEQERLRIEMEEKAKDLQQKLVEQEKIRKELEAKAAALEQEIKQKDQQKLQEQSKAEVKPVSKLSQIEAMRATMRAKVEERKKKEETQRMMMLSQAKNAMANALAEKEFSQDDSSNISMSALDTRIIEDGQKKKMEAAKAAAAKPAPQPSQDEDTEESSGDTEDTRNDALTEVMSDMFGGIELGGAPEAITPESIDRAVGDYDNTINIDLSEAEAAPPERDAEPQQTMVPVLPGTSGFNSVDELLTQVVLEEDEVSHNTVKISNKSLNIAYPLDAGFTFANMITATNRFAHAASISVIDSPGTMYNPLFLFGGTGTGKTHFMHAIANDLMRERNMKNLLITDGLRLSRGVQQLIFEKRVDSFNEIVNSSDALFIDDIHLTSISDDNREYLSRLLNAFKDLRKQIIITSVYPPTSLNRLEQALNFTLNDGWVVELKRPLGNHYAEIIGNNLKSRNIVLSSEDMSSCFLTPMPALSEVHRMLNGVKVLQYYLQNKETMIDSSDFVKMIFSKPVHMPLPDEAQIAKMAAEQVHTNGKFGRLGVFIPKGESKYLPWVSNSFAMQLSQLGIENGFYNVFSCEYDTASLLLSAFRIAELCYDEKLDAAIIVSPIATTVGDNKVSDFHDFVRHMLESVLVSCGWLRYENMAAPQEYLRTITELLREERI